MANATTAIKYRGRRYDVTDLDVVEGTTEGFANVVNSCGASRLLLVVVDGDGRIARAATPREPWSNVTYA
jgi:hypothetical protein